MLGYSNGIAEQGSEYGAALADEEFWRLDFDLWVGVTFIFWGFDGCQISHWEFTYDLKSLTSSAQTCDLKWWRTINNMTWHDITWLDMTWPQKFAKICDLKQLSSMTWHRSDLECQGDEESLVDCPYGIFRLLFILIHHFARILNSRQGKAWLCQRGSCWANML